MNYKNLTFSALSKIMIDFNKNNCIEHKCEIKQGIKMIAKVVLKLDVFRDDLRKYYSNEQVRTLYFTNYEKAFCKNDIGYSIFASNEFITERIESLIDDDFELCEIIEINGKEVE